MKKITSILVLMFAFAFASNAATITYYVETTGSNANDGLSLAAPFDSITTAITAATAAYANDNADNDFVIEVGAGTFTEANFIIDNVTLTINGQGANATILQGGESLTTTSVRVFGACSNISVVLNDLAVRNYGASVGSAASSALMDLEIAGRNMEVNRVAFSNIAGSYAIIARIKNNNVLVFNECSFTDITAVNNSNLIIIPADGTVEFNNCFFNNCVREYTAGNTTLTGIIVYCSPTTANKAKSTFINNTFVNCGVVNDGGYGINNRQGLIMTKSGGITFHNNIICATKKAAITDFRDLILYNAGYTIPCSNNIYESIGAAATAVTMFESNYVDTLLLSDPELDFKMDGGELVIDTTATGVVYATAMGDSVVGQASGATQTLIDIAGSARSIPGCIGAFEYEEQGGTVALEPVTSATVDIYPNPVQDVLFIKGDVARVAIYSISGLEMKSAQYTSAGVNVSYLNSGVYFVRCEDANGSTLSTQRIMKK